MMPRQKKSKKVFKEFNVKLYGASQPTGFQDAQEAFVVLSRQETKNIDDKELASYNESDGFENYEIKDQNLTRTYNSLQSNMEERCNSSSGRGSKIAKGCMWIVIIVIVMMLQMCITTIMKQQVLNTVRNHYSYVMPQKNFN